MSGWGARLRCVISGRHLALPCSFLSGCRSGWSSWGLPGGWGLQSCPQCGWGLQAGRGGLWGGCLEFLFSEDACGRCLEAQACTSALSITLGTTTPSLGMPPLKTSHSGSQPRSLPRRGLPRALVPIAPCHFPWAEGKAYYLSPRGDARGQGFQRLGCDGQETEGLQALPGMGSGLGGRALFESCWRLKTSIS